MCCHDRGEHTQEQRHGCGCGCSGGGEPRRRYRTREEQIAELEPYLAELKKEVQAAEGRLAELRK